MTSIEEKRIEIAAACRDADYIPKVASAGSVHKTADGLFLQTMHNGIQVLADAYYDQFNTEIVRRLRGHHEPQEEKVFHEVLTRIQPGGVMIELGAYWAYYSLWFHKAIPRSTNYMIEGVAENLKVGQSNFQFNGFEGHFKHALVGREANSGQSPPTITIDDFIEREALQRVAMLHADIQGHEYEMLLGARKSFQKRLFEFIFISSHGYKVHAQCLKFLRRHGYRIICEHTIGESYAVDGLIVATVDSGMGVVKISKRPAGFNEKMKSLFCRIISRFPV